MFDAQWVAAAVFAFEANNGTGSAWRLMRKVLLLETVIILICAVTAAAVL